MGNLHFWSTLLCQIHVKKEFLIANGHLVAGTRLEDILGDTSIYTVGLQTYCGCKP